MDRICTITLLIAVMAACTDSPPQQQRPSAEHDRQVIDSLYQVWISAATGGDAQGYASMFADSGALMPPNGPAVVGQSAIERWAADFLSKYALEAQITASSGVQVSGDLAYFQFTATGRYVPKTAGTAAPFDQKYVDVWRRQADGSWKLQYHFWSSNSSDRSVWR
jgi:uncharacterized protein (TIGR02246 family)